MFMFNFLNSVMLLLNDKPEFLLLPTLP